MKRSNRIKSKLIKISKNETSISDIEDYIVQNWNKSKWDDDKNFYYVILQELKYFNDGEGYVYDENPKTFYNKHKNDEDFYAESLDDYLDLVIECSEYIILSYDLTTKTFNIKECGWNHTDNDDSLGVKTKYEICSLRSLYNLIEEDKTSEEILDNLISKYKNKYTLDINDFK